MTMKKNTYILFTLIIVGTLFYGMSFSVFAEESVDALPDNTESSVNSQEQSPPESEPDKSDSEQSELPEITVPELPEEVQTFESEPEPETVLPESSVEESTMETVTEQETEETESLEETETSEETQSPVIDEDTANLLKEYLTSAVSGNSVDSPSETVEETVNEEEQAFRKNVLESLIDIARINVVQTAMQSIALGMIIGLVLFRRFR